MGADLVVNSIATALLGGTAVLIAATGELLVEKLGVYNIGLEGIMLMGALAGFATMESTGSATIGLIGAVGGGAAFSLLFGIAVVIFRADMLMAGLALVFIGTGLSGELGNRYVGVVPKSTISGWAIPYLSNIPYVGKALFQNLSMVYVAVLLPFATAFVLNHTRHGLNMRAIGEDPAAADAAGIPVSRWRLIYVAIGGGFAGLAGGFLTLGVVDNWVYLVTGGQGWIALAIVIFAAWRPLSVIFGAYLFGGLGTLGDVAQAEGWNLPSQFFSGLPYGATLLVLILLAWLRTRRLGWSAWPAALGQPFFRGAS